MLSLNQTLIIINQNNMANSAKRAQANLSFGLPILLFWMSYTISVIHLTLCKQLKKFMRLADSPDLPVGYSGSAVGNQKYIAPEIPADGTFLLELMGSLSRMVNQGLSLPVVVETSS